MSLKKAVSHIDKMGILLVYPIDNRPEPPSLWSQLHPRTPMRWEWDDNGDDRVSQLWHLRAELSSSRKVVYTKWYRNRATFFSREAFVALLGALGSARGAPYRAAYPEARTILENLELDSPMSTKQIKLAADLRGKLYERAYERAMRELWSQLLIVGFGEVDDGAFPSLAVGATRLIFEDLWEEAAILDAPQAWENLQKLLPQESLFLKQVERTGIASGYRNESTQTR